MSTIAACLIVKNEAATIARCLESIAAKVDAIYVYDTGSTDDTPKIAQKYANVIRGSWHDDFARARNLSMAGATTDWLFWLDADEELVEQGPGAFRDLIGRLPEWGCLLNVVDSAPENAGIEALRWNIFPNGKGVRFKGRIHEQPSPWPNGNPPARTDLAYIIHHGYNQGKAVMDAKAKRNLAILKQALRDEPDSLHYHTELGRTQWYLGDMDACWRAMRSAIELWRTLDYPEWASCHIPFMFAAAAALKMGRHDLVGEAYCLCPREAVSAELLCCLGDSLMERVLYDSAAMYFRRAVMDSAVVHPSLHERDKSTTYPLHRLGQLDVIVHNGGLGECTGTVVD